MTIVVLGRLYPRSCNRAGMLQSFVAFNTLRSTNCASTTHVSSHHREEPYAQNNGRVLEGRVNACAGISRRPIEETDLQINNLLRSVRREEGNDLRAREVTAREAALETRLRWLQPLTTKAREITGAGGAQLPLKLQPLLLLGCFFLGFFLCCHNHLLTSLFNLLHVQTAIVSALPMHRSRCGM